MKKMTIFSLLVCFLFTIFLNCAAIEQMIEESKNQPCKTYIGTYVTYQRAYEVRNDLIEKGIDAWVDAGSVHTTGELYVYAMLPCQ